MQQNVKKFHHRVPRSYLARFSHNKVQLCFFDFKAGRSEISNIKRLGGSRFFYRIDDKFSSKPFHVEDELGRLEGRYPRLFDRIITNPQITHQDRVDLSRFLILQYTRTQSHRAVMRKATINLVEELRAAGEQNHPKYGYPCSELADDIEAQGINEFSDSLSIERLLHGSHYERIVEHWKSYSFVVGKAPDPYSVWTSDNPIVLAFDVFRAVGTTGLLSPFILMLFPLDHQHILFVSSESLGPESARRGLFRLPQKIVEHYNMAQASACDQQVFWDINYDSPKTGLACLQQHCADPTTVYWGKDNSTGWPILSRDLMLCLEATLAH